jgi:hypothetical protein
VSTPLSSSQADDHWVENITAPPGEPLTRVAQDLIAGLTSAQSEVDGWNAIVRPALSATAGAVLRLSSTLLRVRLGGFPGYNILQSETISVSVPASAVVSQRLTEARPFITILPVAGSARLSGSCNGAREEVLRSLQPCTIDVLLSDDTWVSGLDVSAAGEELVTGFSALDPQPAGWNTASVGVLSVKQLTVLDPSLLRVTVPQMAAYDILFAEEIGLALPAAALSSRRPLRSNNTLRIVPSAGEAALGGALLGSLDERSIQLAAGGVDLRIRLTGDSFVAFQARETAAVTNASSTVNGSLLNRSAADAGVAGGGPNASACAGVSNATACGNATAEARVDVERLLIIAGIRSDSDGPAGWNAIVQPALTLSSVERLSATEVVVSIPAAPAFSIDSPETVRVSLAPGLLASQERIDALPILRIAALGGSARLHGALAEGTDEMAVAAGMAPTRDEGSDAAFAIAQHTAWCYGML